MRKVIVAPVAIMEMPDHESGHCWLLYWSPQDWERHNTAVEALQAVQTRDRMLIESGAVASVTMIEWTVRTAVGRAVVNVLKEGK